MNVRAKFWVTSITHYHTQTPDVTNATVKLAPVYDDANKDWSKWTPQGEISMMITNPVAVAAFSLGAKYFVDFTPAE